MKRIKLKNTRKGIKRFHNEPIWREVGRKTIKSYRIIVEKLRTERWGIYRGMSKELTFKNELI